MNRGTERRPGGQADRRTGKRGKSRVNGQVQGDWTAVWGVHVLAGGWAGGWTKLRVSEWVMDGCPVWCMGGRTDRGMNAWMSRGTGVQVDG